MTSKQRILTAVRHQEPDRVPVGPRIGAFLQEYYGHSGWMYDLKAAAEFDFDPLIFVSSPYPNYISDLRAAYEDLEEVRVDLTIERLPESTIVRRRIETPAGPLTDIMRRYKGGIGYGASPNPLWEERLVKDEADLERLAFLLPKPNPVDFTPVVETQALVGERGLVQLSIDSAIDHRAGWAYEVVDMMVAAYEKPDFLRRLLRLFQDNVLEVTRCALEAGVEVIFTPWYFASLSAGWSPRLFQELFLPLIREQVDLVHDYGRIYHYYDDGKCATILPWLRDCGIDIVSTLTPPPVGDVNLREAKMAIGDRVCLNGNIDLIYVIKMGTPEVIHETIRQAILDAAPGGGFILGT
ncbi:MAG: uroporphyrinogen decarboxylase family protein, partial [Anaerolineae bacterium]